MKTSHRRADGSLPRLAGGDNALMPHVRELSQRLDAARAEAAEAWTVFNTAREAHAASKDPRSTNSETYRAAAQASEAYSAARDRAKELETERESLLGLATADGPNPSGPNGSQDGQTGARAAAAAGSVDLVKTPGGWLSSAIDRRRPNVPTLPDHLRQQAAAPSIVTNGVANTAQAPTIVESDALFDLLTPRSVAIASGIEIIRIDGTKTNIPRFTELPEADWIAELGQFPKSAPGIERVEIEPSKVGVVTPLSTEVFEDMRPMMLSMLQVQIVRAIALAFDKGILFGSGVDPEPRGVANTVGIGVIQAGQLTNLGAFAAAIGALISSDASIGALVMNPLDIAQMLTVTESSDGNDSNVPLWKTPITSATGLRLPYFNTPIWTTRAVPRGQALMYDPQSIAAVIRREADIAIDPYYDFDTGKVGFRCYLRGDVVVGQPDGAVLIIFGTAATAVASTDLVTAAGAGIHDYDALQFDDITGGAPLVEGTTYYARDTNAATFKVSATPGGTAINLTSDMTAGRVRKV